MKKLLLLFCLNSLSVFAQNPAMQVLRNFNDTIQKLQKVSYDRAFEINNPAENYFHKDTSSLYIEFDLKYPAEVFRTMRIAKNFKRIFTQENMIYINTSENTFEQSKSQINQAQIYHSLLDFRVSLPQLLQEKELIAKLKDTIINKVSFYQLSVTLPPSLIIDFPKGLNKLTIPTIVSSYTFVLDKKTYLPYLLIYTNTNNADYNVKSYFLNLNTQPHTPDASLWILDGYPTFTKAEEKVKNKEIQVGEMFPEWELPQFPSQKNTSHNSLKGKITVLEFWVKNCGFCQTAFKEMKQLSEKYNANSVNILSINMEDTDTLKDLEFIYVQNQPTHNMLYKGEDLAKNVGIYSYPRTIILDETGKVILHQHGFSFEKVDTFLENKLNTH